jgi:hypothetical protein
MSQSESSAVELKALYQTNQHQHFDFEYEPGTLLGDSVAVIG